MIKNNEMKTEEKKPDYDGFYHHLKEYEKHGIPTGFKDLIRLAVRYNCEIPTIKNGELIFKTI